MGGLGALDVIVDGNTVYSKPKGGRLPTTEEILNRLPAH